MRLRSPLRPSSLTWQSLTAAVAAVILIQLTRLCHSGSVCSGMCTVVDETKCTCTIKPLIAGSSQVGNYVSCTGLGNVTAVPAFVCSLTLTEFSITESSVAAIQTSAFAGFKAESLWMTGLGIRSVDARGFAGLESTLKTISLGYNGIRLLAGDTFIRLEKLGSVILEHNALTEIASGLFRNLSQVVNINLQWNNISTLHGDAFDGLDSLQTLDISDNSIADLPANFLIGAAQVRELHLAGNRLTSLTSPAFNAMPNMITLDLSRNLLSYLPPNMLPGCPKLNVLYLSFNNISSISSLAIAALHQLQIIDADNNNISLIPFDAFVNALTLKEASFAYNAITQLDPGLFRNTLILQTLNLSHNSIHSVPDDVFPQDRSGVKILDMSHNRLTQANFLARLAGLLIADISYNQIDTVNFTITPQLGFLIASNNRIAHLSKEMLFRLPMLKELYLDYNLIESVEIGWLDGNRYLRTLSLGNNLLSTVPLLNGTSLNILKLNDNRLTSIAFLNCPVLSELYLQNNLFGTIENMFIGLTSLRVLDLSNNSIGVVPQYAFADVPNLRTLRLADNGIGVVSSENFYGLANLGSLDLSGNDLPTLAYAAMSDLLTNKLTAVFLASNPFICSCEVLWVRGSRVLQDRNTSVCFIDRKCYRLMCNPVKSCPQAVSPLYGDGDPFCLEVPEPCPKSSTTSYSRTTISASATHTMTSDWAEITTTAAAAATAEKPKETYIYVIIGVVVGVALLIIVVVIVVCLIRGHLRNRKDHLKQIRNHRGSINDKVGILKDQTSELDDSPPTPAPADPGENGKQDQQVFPSPTMSDPDLDSSFRPRPKGTAGFPFGNFRIPGSDGRRWRAGGQVDRPPYEFDNEAIEQQPETSKGDDDNVPDRKRRKNESQFVDDNSDNSGDFSTKFANYLLWRGGHKGPYRTEQLPKNKDDDDEDDVAKNQEPNKSEFIDDQEGGSIDLQDTVQSSKYGDDLLWRGGPKGPYKTEKLPKDWGNGSEDDEHKKRKQEFIDDQGDTQFSDLDDADQNYRRGDDLLWRGSPRGPYKTEKLPKDWGDSNEDDGTNKRKHEFLDDQGDTQFSDLDDAGQNSKRGGDLLWRGGRKGPYEAERLPKGFRKEEDDTPPESSHRSKSEFNDDEENFPSTSADRFRFPSGVGSDLLWRQTKKGPYRSEKLTIYESDDDEPSKQKSETTKKKHQSKGRSTEFTEDEEQYPGLSSGDYRMPVTGADLLWRANQKGPYSSAKFGDYHGSAEEPNAKDASAIRTQTKRDKRKSEFVGDEENFADPSSDGFRLPFETGTGLLWRGAPTGPYATSKLAKAYSVNENGDVRTDKKTERRRQRRGRTNSFVDDPTANKTYAAGNFRFPSTTGDDILWRVGQKRPYSTLRLPTDYFHDGDVSSHTVAASQTHGRMRGRRRPQRQQSNETEYLDSDGNSSPYSSSFGGFRIPGGGGGGGASSTLQWRNFGFGDGPVYPDRMSLDGMQGRRGRRGTESLFDSDARSNLSEPYGKTFQNFKTNPNKRPNTLYWKVDRMTGGLASKSATSSPVAIEELSRRRSNSGSDLSANSDENRKLESPSSDHIRRPHGTAKAATARKKTQMQSAGNLPKIQSEIDC